MRIEQRVVESQSVNFGRSSEVFSLGEGKILKLYEKGFPHKKVEFEFNNTKAVRVVLGELVPKVYGLEVVEGRSGIVMEEIKGESIMDTYRRNPLMYFTEGRLLARLHSSIFVDGVKGVISQGEMFSPIISGSGKFSRTERELVLGLLKEHGGNKLCHGDFHHGNVMRSEKGGFVILDWMDAFVGDPRLDISLTAVSAAISDAPEHVSGTQRTMYEVLKKVMRVDRRILGYYSDYIDGDKEVFLLLASAIHLARKVGSDKEHRKYFKNLIQRF